MKLLLALALLAGQAHAEPAFRGYGAIEQTFTDRLMADGAYFSFKRYLRVEGQDVDARSLLALLGTYDNSSGTNEFHNGDPNSVNMLLWQVLLQAAGEELTDRCRQVYTIRLHPAFKAVWDPLCQWPAPEAKTEETLRALWIAVMGYDAPEEEFRAWQRFALTSSYASKPAAEALPKLFFLITYNPYFLLRN